jgi:hypothetical protein
MGNQITALSTTPVSKGSNNVVYPPCIKGNFYRNPGGSDRVFSISEDVCTQTVNSARNVIIHDDKYYRCAVFVDIYIIYIEIFIHISIHIVWNLNPYLGYKIIRLIIIMLVVTGVILRIKERVSIQQGRRCWRWQR